MLQIRSYSGTVEDWQAFVVKVWSDSYSGKMLFPRWTPDYFRWQMAMGQSQLPSVNQSHSKPGSDEPASANVSPDHCLAAYDGERMVGTILGIPFRFRGNKGEFYGSQGSWLSVDPEYRRHKVATKLREEVRKRHLQLGMLGQFGFVYFASRSSQGPRFWGNRQIDTNFLQKIGFWARVLNPTKASAWSISRWEAFTMSLARFQLRPRFRSKRFEVRPFQQHDLSGCLDVVRQLSQSVEMSIDWDGPSLSVLLGGEWPNDPEPRPQVGRSLLAVRNGKVIGVLAYHLLPFQGRTIETVSVIDLIAFGELTGGERSAFLNAALEKMTQENAILALKASFGDYAVLPMWRAGFVPQPSHSHLILTGATEGTPLERVRRSHLIWR